MAYIDIAQQTEARELIVGQRDNHMNETVIYIAKENIRKERRNCVLFVLFPFLLHVIILFPLFILLPIIYTCPILWHCSSYEKRWKL